MIITQLKIEFLSNYKAHSVSQSSPQIGGTVCCEISKNLSNNFLKNQSNDVAFQCHNARHKLESRTIQFTAN
jgi:transposase